jgi:hypothetical protein
MGIITESNFDLLKGAFMSLAENIIPFSEAKKNLSKIATDLQHNNQEKIITKNGKAFMVFMTPQQLDYYHELEKNNWHAELLGEAEKGLADYKAGRTLSLEQMKKRHASK